MRPLLTRVLAAIGLLQSACFFDGNAPVCNPGEARDCTCNTAQGGRQTCNGDGLAYSACECLVDASTDAPDSSTTPDASDAPFDDASPAIDAEAPDATGSSAR